MPSLTPKKIDGHTYYYARYCQRVDGKPKIVRTVYLGRIEDLVATTEAGRQPPLPQHTVVRLRRCGGPLAYRGTPGGTPPALLHPPRQAPSGPLLRPVHAFGCH